MHSSTPVHGETIFTNQSKCPIYFCFQLELHMILHGTLMHLSDNGIKENISIKSYVKTHFRITTKR